VNTALTIPTFTAADFLPVMPAAILTIGAIIVLLSEVFLSNKSRAHQAPLSVITALIAMVVAVENAFEPAREVLQGFAVLDPLGSWNSALVSLAAALASLLAAGFLKHRNAERGEFYALMLFGAAGMSLLGLSSELITLFINLEVLSVATYALTAYLRRGPRSAEAGFKYFILGAFSASVLVYGAALLYGATGTTKLNAEMVSALTTAMAPGSGKQMLVYCAFLLLAMGFAFKVAAVPFHMWTPDVYEGAPTPVTALMSAAVKAAAFVAMVRTFLFVGKVVTPEVVFAVLAALAALTMVAGNLMALPQRNVKRMLAYSSIAHAGYLLLAVAALFVPASMANNHDVSIMSASPLGLAPNLAADLYKGILFYLLGYTVTAIGAFGTLSAIERREDETRGSTWDLDRLSGLAQRKPFWAAAMAAFMLSLGGIPPTVGFMGKLLIFRGAVDAGLLGLSLLGILASAAGVYYYLRVVVYMYMRPVPEGAQEPARFWTTELALGTSAVLVVVLGIAPGTITEWLSRAGMVFGR
jgi:NADH-quinone oxidoreductase subunit N